MRHYAFNAGDYSAATAHLSDAEDLAYRRLLDAYYVREAPLPADEAACCRLARATTPAARKAVGVVLREYFALDADGWHQKRADIEIDRLRIKSASARSSVNVRHGRDREARRKEDERREVEKAYERITNVVRSNSGAASPRIPPTTHDPQPTTTPIQRTVVEAAAKPRTTRNKTRLPADWRLPKAWGEWAQAERGWPADEVRRVADLFADHWRGKGEARADWQATWRNWVRRETTRAGPRSDAKTESRNAFAASILGDIGHDQQAADHSDPRDISGEAVRVA